MTLSNVMLRVGNA